MLANRPRAGLFTQTFGGVYSVVALISGSPAAWAQRAAVGWIAQASTRVMPVRGRWLQFPSEREATMRMIDVQDHAYERNHPGRPWVGQLHGPQSANGEEMIAAMDAVGVDAAIIVSTFNLYRYDPSYALEVYASYPDRFRVVKPI